MISSHKIERKILVSICKDNQNNFLYDPPHQVVPVGASTQPIHPDLALLGVAGPQLEHLVDGELPLRERAHPAKSLGSLQGLLVS